jgi:hypothetical protein
MAQISTVMVQDGSGRLVRLIRGDDGLYTLQSGPSNYDTHLNCCDLPPSGFGEYEVDLTQAIYQAMRREMVEEGPLYWKAKNAAENDKLQAQVTVVADAARTSGVSRPLTPMQRIAWALGFTPQALDEIIEGPDAGQKGDV